MGFCYNFAQPENSGLCNELNRNLRSQCADPVRKCAAVCGSLGPGVRILCESVRKCAVSSDPQCADPVRKRAIVFGSSDPSARIMCESVRQRA